MKASNNERDWSDAYFFGFHAGTYSEKGETGGQTSLFGNFLKFSKTKLPTPLEEFMAIPLDPRLYKKGLKISGMVPWLDTPDSTLLRHQIY